MSHDKVIHFTLTSTRCNNLYKMQVCAAGRNLPLNALRIAYVTCFQRERVTRHCQQKPVCIVPVTSTSLHTMVTSTMSSKYRAAHAEPHGPGDARPTAVQILQDEGLLTFPNRLEGKTVLITGGTSGLGFEAAKALHQARAKVFISGRCDATKGHDIAASIQSATEHKSTYPAQFIRMDLSDFDSVKSGASDFLSKANGAINLLICNAGVMAVPTRETTKQGHEMQFGVNYLSHFLLFEVLRPALLASSTSEFASRAVMVSSCAHRGSGLVQGYDYDFETTPYDAGVSYGQSKTANIYAANEIERRFGAQGLHGLSVHPGVIMDTGLVRHMTDNPAEFESMLAQNPKFRPQTKSPPQGAASILWAAVATELEARGGQYLEDCSIGQPVEKDVEWWDPGYSAWCYDQAAEERLWMDSEKMVKAWL